MSKQQQSYECTACLETFDYDDDWTDEDASVEFAQRFETENIRDAAIVCDDCYKQIMGDS